MPPGRPVTFRTRIEVRTAMAPHPTLRDADAIVVGGFAEDPDFPTLRDTHVQRVTRGLQRVGLVVGVVNGRDRSEVVSLAEALDHAVRDGKDGVVDDRTDDRGGTRTATSTSAEDTTARNRKRLRVVVLLGLDSRGDSGDKAGVTTFTNDAQLKWHTKKFAMCGGVVLLNGMGGSLDCVLREWFRKPWTSGLTRIDKTWRYNADAAWGDGFFARFNATSEFGKPAQSITLASAAELESVPPSERVYYADKTTRDTLWCDGDTKTPKTEETSSKELTEPKELKGPAIDTSAKKPGSKNTGSKQKIWSGYKHDDDAFSDAGGACVLRGNKRSSTSVAFGAYGGGFVGAFGDLRCENATAAIVTALASASAGVTATSLAKLRRSPLRGVNLGRKWVPLNETGRGGLFVGTGSISGTQETRNTPSACAFFVYAVCTTCVTSFVFFLLARAILNS